MQVEEPAMSLPFPRAHYYVAAFLVVTIVAFHPSYFGSLREAPFAHHFHGTESISSAISCCIARV